MVMPVGAAIGRMIDTAGFTVTDSITLLGLQINQLAEDFSFNFEVVYEKILRIANFWERFRLTLPGRISVAKTLMLPQINYLGCFLDPGEDFLKRAQTVIDDFILNRLNVSKERRYLPPDRGGLGIIHLETFLDSQRCSWVGRAYKFNIDNWRYDLKTLAPNNNIAQIRGCDVDRRVNPILYNIVSSFDKLVCSLTTIDNNYIKAHFVDNPAFKRSAIDNRPLDKNFFGNLFYNNNKNILRSLTFEQCFPEGTYRTLEGFMDIGLRITIALWMKLSLALNYNKRLLSSEPSSNVVRSVEHLLDSVKKGSAKFRRILLAKSINLSDPSLSQSVVTFNRNVSLDIPDKVNLLHTLGVWNLSFLSNDHREFFFLERNNLLRVGAVAIHIWNNVNDRCTFCRILNPDTVNRETFIHLFKACPVTINLLRGLTRTVGLLYNLDTEGFNSMYWNGIKNGKFHLDILLIFEMFRHCVWSFKKRRIIPTQINFAQNFTSTLNTIKLLRYSLYLEIATHFDNVVFSQAMG
jgi:hypothetical protein